MLICLEGLDAAGKATQSARLAERLRAILYSFPDYSTPMGHLIMGHLKGYWSAVPAGATDYTPKEASLQTLDAMVFQALQLANRMEHALMMREHLVRGSHVVVDRYWPSGVVYGGADGLHEGYLRLLHAFLPQPDLFLLLKIDPTLSVARRPERRDRYEKQAGLMEDVARRYDRLWAQAKDDPRWQVIDAAESVEVVEESIWRLVQRRLEGIV